MKKNANLPALIFMFALLIVWQCIAMGMNAAYILPSPAQVLVRLWELRKPLFTAHLPATMLCTGVGLAISIALGLLLAIVMDASPSAEKMLYPLIVASQTIPTTALAPLFVLWFGYTIWSKVLVTVLSTFFPIAMTVFDGFRSAKTDMVDISEPSGAGRRKFSSNCRRNSGSAAVRFHQRRSKALIPMSIIGAAIGEWLGAQAGLGYFSRRTMTQLDGAGVFAPIVLLSVVAMIAVGIVSWLEKKIITWRSNIA